MHQLDHILHCCHLLSISILPFSSETPCIAKRFTYLAPFSTYYLRFLHWNFLSDAPKVGYFCPNLSKVYRNFNSVPKIRTVSSTCDLIWHIAHQSSIAAFLIYCALHTLCGRVSVVTAATVTKKAYFLKARFIVL